MMTVNGEVEGISKEALKVFTQDSWSPEWDSNPEPPKYEEDILHSGCDWCKISLCSPSQQAASCSSQNSPLLLHIMV